MFYYKTFIQEHNLERLETYCYFRFLGLNFKIWDCQPAIWQIFPVNFARESRFTHRKCIYALIFRYIKGNSKSINVLYRNTIWKDWKYIAISVSLASISKLGNMSFGTLMSFFSKFRARRYIYHLFTGSGFTQKIR